MKRRNLSLGILLAVLLPALNIVNNNGLRRTTDYSKLLFSWLIGALFLLIIWIVNQVISDSAFGQRLKGVRWLLYIGVNGLCIAAMGPVLQHFSAFRLATDTPEWVLFIRLGLAVAMVLTVQSAIRAREMKDAIALQNQQLLNENLQSRFDALRQQINPHFLFNSLGTLRTMVRPDNPDAEQFILHLSDVYRQLLNRKESTTVSVSEEIEFLRSYLYMLEARFEQMLQVTIDVAEEDMERRVPSFCLQLLVENCIKHNVVSSELPLVVRIYTEEGGEGLSTRRRLVVSNNLRLKTAPEPSSGTGLANLYKRYELLGVQSGVQARVTGERFEVSLIFVGLR